MEMNNLLTSLNRPKSPMICKPYMPCIPLVFNLFLSHFIQFRNVWTNSIDPYSVRWLTTWDQTLTNHASKNNRCLRNTLPTPRRVWSNPINDCLSLINIKQRPARVSWTCICYAIRVVCDAYMGILDWVPLDEIPAVIVFATLFFWNDGKVCGSKNRVGVAFCGSC